MTLRSDWANNSDWKRENARQFNELSRRGELHKSVAVMGMGSEAFASVAAVSSAIMVPAGDYTLASNVPLSGDLSWWQQPGANYSGAGDIQTLEHPGFYFTADLKDIRIAETRGTPTDPDSTTQPLMFLSRNTDAAYGSEAANATLVLQNNKYATSADARAQALFAETIARAGGASTFVEGIRTHGIVPSGFDSKAYGIISYAENGGAGINTVGMEAEIGRLGGADNVDPYTWVNGQLLDAAFLATVRVGHKPLGLFIANPYNEVTARAGFLVGNSFAAQGVARTIVENAFETVEDNITAALKVRGTGIYTCLDVPNVTPIIRAVNGAGSAQHNILHYSTDNIVHVGSEATGVKLYGATFIGTLINAANDAAAAAAGVAVGQLYRTGSSVMQRIV